MRKALPSVAAAILLLSCSRYEYVTIKSADMDKNDHDEFVAENDSIRIQYNFNGQDAPIRITIENKSAIPVYVNWQQSALIINDKALSYSPNTVPIQESSSSSTYTWFSNGYTSSSGSISGTASLPDEVQFIPPHSYVTKNPMGVTNELVTNLPDSVYGRAKVPVPGSAPVGVKHLEFTETSSPLRFRSYLTLIFGEKESRALPYDHSFYISEIYKTGIQPADFWYANPLRGDQYYVKKLTGAGKGFGIVGGIAILTTVEALNQSLEQKSTHKAGRY